jgi:hypothetical protein
MSWLRAVTVAVLAVTLGGCYAYSPPPPWSYYNRPVGCVWVPGHHQPFYGWVPGHWRC